ncbi:MAG: hypothetical protein IJ928_06740 [Prevotella sp.]|nr:hypothetical protein [Prevotella sp.]
MPQSYAFFFKVGAHGGIKIFNAPLFRTCERPLVPGFFFSIYSASFCKDFSWKFCAGKRFDRKSLGEILKIERRNLEDFPPKFAVKIQLVLNRLIINKLQKWPQNAAFVNIFYRFRAPFLPSKRCRFSIFGGSFSPPKRGRFFIRKKGVGCKMKMTKGRPRRSYGCHLPYKHHAHGLKNVSTLCRSKTFV